jgi:hypothetical protein
MKTEFNLKTTPRDMMIQLLERAKSLTLEQKAEVREALMAQMPPVPREPS